MKFPWHLYSTVTCTHACMSHHACHGVAIYIYIYIYMQWLAANMPHVMCSIVFKTIHICFI